MNNCLNKIWNAKHILKLSFYYVLNKHKYKKYGFTCLIIKPLRITPKYIQLDEGVCILNNARIEGISKYNEKSFSPNIHLKKGVRIQQNLHLTCASFIEIGENTAIAANVTITDIHHPYEDISKPIERNDIQVNPVIIGPECKLYNNCVILPGTRIGKHVTIGANSVVSGKIPDYSVIVGCPGRVVKRFDKISCRWRKTDAKGNFVDNIYG